MALFGHTVSSLKTGPIKENGMDTSCTTVTVLSRNYSTGLGVIRSLGAAGYTVDLIASTKKKGSSIIAKSSRYVRSAQEVLSPDIQTDDGELLVAALIEYADKIGYKTVLFPTDDFTASVAAKNRDALKEHFYMPEVTEKAGRSLTETMDKTVQSALARKAGLLTPAEVLVDLSGDIEIPDGVGYPCFVKPYMSIAGHKNEMAVCRDEAELMQQLRAMKKRNANRSVLVQEYLNITKEYDLSGLCLDGEIIIPAIIEKTRIAGHERGVTLSGRVLPLETMGGAVDRIVEFLRSLHYVGMFDMELNLCGDRLYFGEVNLRSGGPNFAYYLSGVNLPDIFVKEITGQGHSPSEEAVSEFGREFVYEKVAWEDYIYSYMTRRELKDCIRSADYTLLCNDDDPAPGRIFKRRIRLSAVKHRIKILLGLEKSGGADKKAKPRVVVTGRNYCNILSIARALGKAGYDVEVLRLFKKSPHPLNLLRRMKPEAHSRYVSSYCELTIGDHAERFADYLISNASDRKTLLIPTDDYSAFAADNVLRRLNKYYIVPNIAGTQGEIIRLMDKNEQKRIAAKFDIPLLESRLIKSANGSFEIPEGVVYPCFVKPNVSMKSTKAQMLRCDDAEALEKALTSFAAKGDFEVLAEQYADIKNEYSVLGVSVDDAVAAPCVFRTTRGGHRERKGVALTGETVCSSELEPVIDKCAELVRSLHYTGMFDIDLIETADGRIYFTELNFRAGASLHAFTESGVNLPGMLADCLVKDARADESCRVYKTGRSFVSEKVLMEEFARGDVSAKQARSLMKEAEIHFVKDGTDLRPYRYFRIFYAFAALLRIPYRLRDRKAK